MKEADALSEAGYQVTVIFSYWNAWGDEFTRQLLLKKNWTAIQAGGHPDKTRFVYLLSRIVFKLSRSLFIQSKLFTDAAISRSEPFLLREAKKHRADLYIGHNLGALPAVVKAAKKYSARCGFDAEDFHRMEVSDDTTSVNYLIAKATEDCYFPALDYITASSPEISAAYQQLYPQMRFPVILNVFNRSSVTLKNRNDNCIKLLWFSQTVGRKRGLQDVIEALNSLYDHPYELHLLGAITDEDREYFNSLAAAPFIHFHPPVHPDEVIDFGAQFDIGLALEPGFSSNNNMALSNKLFSYLQSGLAVIATQTEAQDAFLRKNPEIGYSYKPCDVARLCSILIDLQEKPELLTALRQNALKAGQDKFNWETESQKFLKMVTDIRSGK